MIDPNEKPSATGHRKADGSTSVGPKTPKEEGLVKYIKCSTCRFRLRYDTYICRDGGNIRFCKCKEGQESITIIWTKPSGS